MNSLDLLALLTWVVVGGFGVFVVLLLFIVASIVLAAPARESNHARRRHY